MQKELRARMRTPAERSAMPQIAQKYTRRVKPGPKRQRREVNQTFLLYPPVVGHVPPFIKIQGRHEPARRLAHGARERLARADA